MGIKYEVTAVTGKYTDKSGKEKNRYTKVGVVMDTRNGPMLKLEVIPLSWDGWAYLNEPQERKESNALPPASGMEDLSDDIPF